MVFLKLFKEKKKREYKPKEEPSEYNDIGDSYMSHGYKVKRGSKLDKAIKLYHKKGYYVTDISFSNVYGPDQPFRKEPPTLRPALYGGTFHQEHHHHPLEKPPEYGEV